MLRTNAALASTQAHQAVVRGQASAVMHQPFANAHQDGFVVETRALLRIIETWMFVNSASLAWLVSSFICRNASHWKGKCEGEGRRWTTPQRGKYRYLARKSTGTSSSHRHRYRQALKGALYWMTTAAPALQQRLNEHESECARAAWRYRRVPVQPGIWQSNLHAQHYKLVSALRRSQDPTPPVSGYRIPGFENGNQMHRVAVCLCLCVCLRAGREAY